MFAQCGRTTPLRKKPKRLNGHRYPSALAPDLPITTDLIAMPYDYALTFACYNSVHYTKTLVESLVQVGTPLDRVIVVDNGSTDETRDYLLTLPLGGAHLQPVQPSLRRCVEPRHFAPASRMEHRYEQRPHCSTPVD